MTDNTSPDVTPALPADPDAEAKFTQADLDRILAGRLAKFRDYDELKSRAERADAEKMSEVERAVADARRDERAKVMAEVNGRLVSSELRTVAQALGFHNPADASKFVDTENIEVADDGTVDAKALKAALQSVAKDRPYLLATKAPEVKPAPPADDAGIGTTGNRHAATAADAFAGLFPTS